MDSVLTEKNVKLEKIDFSKVVLKNLIIAFNQKVSRVKKELIDIDYIDGLLEFLSRFYSRVEDYKNTIKGRNDIISLTEVSGRIYTIQNRSEVDLLEVLTKMTSKRKFYRDMQDYGLKDYVVSILFYVNIILDKMDMAQYYVFLSKKSKDDKNVSSLFLKELEDFDEVFYKTVGLHYYNFLSQTMPSFKEKNQNQNHYSFIKSTYNKFLRYIDSMKKYFGKGTSSVRKNAFQTRMMNAQKTLLLFKNLSEKLGKTIPKKS